MLKAASKLQQPANALAHLPVCLICSVPVAHVVYKASSVLSRCFYTILNSCFDCENEGENLSCGDQPVRFAFYLWESNSAGSMGHWFTGRPSSTDE